MSKSGLKFTISYTRSKSGNGFFGIVLEVPGVASQGKTVSELKRNLKDATLAMFAANKADKPKITQAEQHCVEELVF